MNDVDARPRSLGTVIFLTTSGAADTVAANCVAQGIQPGGTQNPDFDCRGLLVNIDNHIIPLCTTERERQSSQNGADATSLNFREQRVRELRLQGSLKLPLCSCVSITLSDSS
jgi:hypothetical protein